MLSGEDITERPLPDVEISSQKMGIHEWSYDNDISIDKRYRVPLRDKVVALKDIQAEVELGFDPQARLRRGAALPELRRADRVHRVSSASNATPASTSARWTASPSPQNGEEADLRTRLQGAGHESHAGPLRRRRPQDRPRHGQGRGRLPALRPVRRALPHRRVGHAEISHRHDPRGHTMPAQPDQQRKRLRRPVRQRQRLRLGERQRAVRALDPAHGRAGRRRATSSRPTSRACRPGTRCASPRTAISARAAAST